MIGLKLPVKKTHKDEAEKPFWISFSDLMTALTALFLVTMTVALLAVTKDISEADRIKKQRDNDIESCMAGISSITKTPEFREVNIRGHAIEFGTLVKFENKAHTLPIDNLRFLRQFTPKALTVARTPDCEKWLKRVIVEGFASQVGPYLYNLNLSLQRSQRVLCALLDSQADDRLSEEDRKLIRKLFLVGGSSFNSVKKTPEESRRVELKLEFYELSGDKSSPDLPWDEDSRCPIDVKHG